MINWVAWSVSLFAQTQIDWLNYFPLPPPLTKKVMDRLGELQCAGTTVLDTSTHIPIPIWNTLTKTPPSGVLVGDGEGGWPAVYLWAITYTVSAINGNYDPDNYAVNALIGGLYDFAFTGLAPTVEDYMVRCWCS